MDTTPLVVDLADRHNDDLDVVLLWGRRTNRLWVDVTHRSLGRVARIDASAANALDVFHHPFAYVREGGMSSTVASESRWLNDSVAPGGA
jgi:hypothetical protein